MKKTDYIPFHKPFITSEEIDEVVDTIKSGWWTTGPKVVKFEKAFNEYIGSKFSVTANSWTAAAHLALEAIGLKQGDEVIVPSLTFTATAEIVCYFGAKPVIVDVQRDTYNIDPDCIIKSITPKTRAIIPVHYSGQPCDMDEITEIAHKNKLRIIEDAAHALPAIYKNKLIGTISETTCFSFYATKTLATGEGGMICTSNKKIADRCSIMKLHGISKDAWKRYSKEGSWFYSVVAPGYKYNLTDLQASLGLAQLRKVEYLWDLRKNIYSLYNTLFENNEFISIYKIKGDRKSAHHLYPIELNLKKLKINRAQFIDELRKSGIGASVHFIPLYRHPYYKNTFKLDRKNFPISEKIYPRVISLPIWPGMTNNDIYRTVESINRISKKFTR